MDSFFNDLKHAARMAGQNPGFAITAVAALAIGIGANTAIFTVFNAVLLRPLPYPDADRLVNVGRPVGGAVSSRSSGCGCRTASASKILPLTTAARA